MKKFLHFFEKILGIYRWHPTVALKYLPIVDKLKSLDMTKEELLEVGSGGLGIAPYIKHKVVGVDLEFTPPTSEYLVPIKASVLSLPFIDGAYSVVVSTDMLEHLHQAERELALLQLLRVTKQLLCIAVPCGLEAAKLDTNLAKYINNFQRNDFDFLREHVEYGLPEKSWIIKTLRKNAQILHKQIEIENISKLNIHVRYFLMRGWMSDNLLVNIFFRKILLLVIPLLKFLNTPPCYREFFFVKIQ